jgi:beta-glucosidase
MRFVSFQWIALALAIGCGPAAAAEAVLPCDHFTQDVLPNPEPREHPLPVRRAEQINAAIKSQPYRVLFFGDSLTERFEMNDAPELWRDHMAPRGVLNAGVNGDRTEHLRWRLAHGNLDGRKPQAVVVLIGTNDIGHGRPPDVTAEGIRAVVADLRERLPDVPILLLGLLPRGGSPDARLRQGVEAVNRLIRRCGDDSTIFYRDIGGALLDPQGQLTRVVAPDLLHFSAVGYARLVRQLDPAIDALLAGH